MPWNDLDTLQQDFLKKYLLSGKLDFLFDKHERPENKDTTAAFEAFEKTYALYQQELATIPEDYAEHVLMAGAGPEALALREAGKFEEGSQILAPVLQDIVRTRTRFTGEADELRATANGAIALEGATGEETGRLDALRQAIAATLAAPLPTKADLTAARMAAQAYQTALEQVQEVAGQRVLAKGEFDTAWQAVRARAEGAAALDVAPFDLADNKAAIETAIAEGKKIVELAAEMAGSDDLDRLRAAKSDMEAYALADDPDTLIAAAKAQIKSKLRAKSEHQEEFLRWVCAADGSSFLDGDKATLEAMQNATRADVSAIEDALSGDDIAKLAAVLSDWSDIDSRFRAFHAEWEAANERKTEDNHRQVREYFESLGVPAGRSGGMAELWSKNPDAYNKAGDILGNTATVLGNVEVTPAFIESKEAELEAANDLLKVKYAKLKELDAAKAALKKEYRELKDQLDVLDGKISAPGEGDDVAALQEQKDDLLPRMDAIADQFREKATERQGEFAVYDAARSDAQQAEKELQAAKAQKALLEAINFEALSPDHGEAITGENSVKLLEVLSKDPEIGMKAIEAAARAKNPETVVRAATVLTDRIGNGFESQAGKRWNQKFAHQYANNIIGSIGSLPPEVIDRFEDYLDQDLHREPKPAAADGATSKLRTKNRSAYVATALLKEDGSLDLAAGNRALDDCLFHPRVIMKSTPVQSAHMFETLKFVSTSDEAQEILTTMAAPSDDAAKGLLARGSGKSAGEISTGDAREAVLSAMMTPVYQGNIGSCFATSGIVRLRATKPLETMKIFSEMATVGKYTPADGDAVPVIQNVPLNENALLRSLEFSAATSIARTAGSKHSSRISSAAERCVDTMSDKFKDDAWATLEPRLQAIVADAVTINYDPEADIPTASDGVSKKGRYQMIDAVTKNPINSEEDFLAVIKPKILEAVDESGLKEGVDTAAVEAHISKPAFVNALKQGDEWPWELPSGGPTDTAQQTIFGGTFETHGYLAGIAETAPMPDKGARSAEIIGGLLARYGTSAAPMDCMRTVGKHGFNATMQDPSLAPLKQGGPAKFAANLNRELVEAGEKLKDVEIGKERAIYMFEKDMQMLADRQKDGPAKQALLDAIEAHRPTDAMKPADYQAKLDEATATYRDLRAQERTDRWVARQTEPPEADKIAEKLASYKEQTDKVIENAVMDRLVHDLGSPQFVFADTNWGSGENHTFFVISPNPVDGKPRVFKRSDPSGELKEVSDDWYKANWAVVN